MSSLTPILGLHHISIVSANAQRTIDFYTTVLGLRFIKRTVNFDDPETYHLYFGDEVGHPGSIMTFFPGSRAGPGEEGHDAPGVADLIAEVEMVGLRVIEVHGAFDEPETEQPHVEVEIALRVARDRGDVVDAEDARHDQYSANASSGKQYSQRSPGSAAAITGWPLARASLPACRLGESSQHCVVPHC